MKMALPNLVCNARYGQSRFCGYHQLCILLFILTTSEALQWLSLSSLTAATLQHTDKTAASQFCASIKGLERRQRKVCRQHVEMMGSVMSGAKMSVEECQHQFKGRRWNCTLEQDSIFNSNVREGTREAAFIHSIAAAGVSFTVTKGCSRGDLPGCGCDKSTSEARTDGTFEWSGCSDNIMFGMAFSKKFTDAREKLKKRSGRSLVNLHNNYAGREYVKSNMVMECKCHGVSGSCELRTCWRSLPTFRGVGSILREAFDGAIEVKTKKTEGSRLTLHQPTKNQYKRYTTSDLVYLAASPDFCEQDLKQGSYGTQGRECNKTSKGTDGCDLMCCGRGYHTVIETVVDRCNCKFHWCCFVVCDECQRKVEKNICL